ncbi:hypothetical protein [Fibrobacter sp.]|uniref:hypothetical protein n=1 Tax=Fibrobacter sp. TaxID=35828 RepID=UPI0038906698
MELEQILQEISVKLTGDNKSDIAYLFKITEKYRGHQLETEIVREIGRMIFQRLSKEKQKEWTELLKKDTNQSYYSKFDKVNEKVRNGEYETALSIIEPIVKDLDNMISGGLCRDDSVSEYRHFNSLFEDILYKELNHPTREVRDVFLPIGTAFSMYGSVLIDLNRAESARLALGKARQWEPMNVSLAFECAETYKLQGNMDKFLQATKKVYEIIYKKTDLARFYRNIGYYFIEKKLWVEAMGCFILSLNFDTESSIATGEMAYIEEKAGKKIEWPKIEEIKEICQKYNIPFGPNNNVAAIAYRYGKTLFDEKMSDYAKYFLEIAYSMVPAPEIKKMLDSLGGVIGKVDILKYLDLPKEFQPVRNRPTDPINCESFMMQNTYTAALLQVYPIDVEGTMPFQNPQSVIDGVHRSVKDNQALIEVENGIFDNSAFIYSIVKTLHEQKFTGVQYFMLMHVLIDGQAFAVRGFFDEIGITGVRDNTVWPMLVKLKEIDPEKNDGWCRDPYDKTIKKNYLMNISEEKRFDKLFPEHPLSVCRKFIEHVKNNLANESKTPKESEPIELPKTPAVRPKGKTIFECGKEDLSVDRVSPFLIKKILYTDGRLYKAYYVDSQESIVNGMRKPVLYELVGTSAEAASKLKDSLKKVSEEFSLWPDQIGYRGERPTKYYYSLKFISKHFYGDEMFDAEEFGPHVKDLFESVTAFLNQYFPDVEWL